MAGTHTRRLIMALAALALGAALLGAYKRQFFSGGTEAPRVFVVRAETYQNLIEIAGTISAAKEQNLQAAGSGAVTAVYVKEGDAVACGQLILQLDDTEQRYNLARHDYEAAQKRINGAPRELELMAYQREALARRIKDRQIIAGFDGVIAQFSAAAGDVVEAKDITGLIIDRSYLKATVEVAETDAPRLAAGQRVTFRFPAAGGGPLSGRVHSFPAVASKTTRGASVVKAELRIDDPPDVILPNYSFTGEIEIGPPEALLLVEREAVVFEDEAEGGAAGAGAPVMARPQVAAGAGPPAHGGRGAEPSSPSERGRAASAVRLREDGSTERVAVYVESYGAAFVKILAGLVEGDRLQAP